MMKLCRLKIRLLACLGLSVMCLGEITDYQENSTDNSTVLELHQIKILNANPINRYRKPKQLINTKNAFNKVDKPKNFTALPTFDKFDHTHRPSTLQWRTPKLMLQQPKTSKEVIIESVYRLPVDSDDTGAQVRLVWAYANLKVRPIKITLEAIGPNRATWPITVMEGTQTTATWDLHETPSYSPLIEGYYTINIYDQRGLHTTPRPGWLLPDFRMKIALYKTEGENQVGEILAPSEHATCYRYVMQGLERIEDSSNISHINFSLIILIISFFWILL